jgi:hypothetical protein
LPELLKLKSGNELKDFSERNSKTLPPIQFTASERKEQIEKVLKEIVKQVR